MTFDLRLIPLFPFLGAVLLMLFGRKWSRDFVFVVAALAIGAACIVSVDAFLTSLPNAGAEGLKDVVGTWIATGDLHIDLAFRMDGLSGVMCLVITFVGFLIHVFAAGYMADDPDYARFFAYLNLFCGAMLVLVLGDNLPVLFIGWEGVGLCSYLLIGFWYNSTANADAGKKAFITNRIGDFGFLIGMFLLFQYTGTLSVPEINGAATPGGRLMHTLWLGQPVAFWAALFLFIGATGKSAQIPLYVWLPDAMAGPTPVSALIHAATMVTAGVYMVARMHAVYLLTPAVMAIVAVVGAATAMFAAIIGFAQNDFKKVLAYSTVSQLGFMFAGVGTANFDGGIFHLVTHAFFKAGLFLCAGSVMHAMSGSGDIRIMGGLRKKLPWTHGVFFVCWLAICGIPIFSGFFSKDSIIAGAFATEIYPEQLAWVGKLVGTMLMVAALGTAFYMSRLYYLVFSGDETRADDHIKHHIHESPPIMTVPLVVLAVGAALVGLLGQPAAFPWHPTNLLAHELEPVLGPELEVAHSTEWLFMGASTLLALIGIALAAVFYRGGYQEPARRFAAAFPKFVKLVQDKFRVDELYDTIFIRPIKALARGVYLFVDRIIIDKVLVEGTAVLIDVFSRVARAFQGGDGQRYMAVFAVGVALLVHFATQPTLPFTKLKVTQTGRAVEVDARRAAGRASARQLEYAFDFGDGRPVVKGPGAEQRHDYDKPGSYTIEVTVRDPRWGTEDGFKEKVEVQ